MPNVEIDGYTSDTHRFMAEDIKRQAEQLVRTAAQLGVVLTVTQENLQPPSMGHYAPVVAVRPDRWSVRKAYEAAAGAPVVKMTVCPPCATHAAASAAELAQAIAMEFPFPGNSLLMTGGEA